MHEVPIVVGEVAVAIPSFGMSPWAVGALALLIGGGLGAAGMWFWRKRSDARAGADALGIREEFAFERHFNPYISGEPVRRPEMFFACRDLLNRIAGGLHQNSIMIQGERRIGKTSMLYQLADSLRATARPRMGLHSGDGGYGGDADRSISFT